MLKEIILEVKQINEKITRQLKNLKKDELIRFLDNFVNNFDSLDVTEKFAGQQLKMRWNADHHTFEVSVKKGDFWRNAENFNYYQEITLPFRDYFVDNHIDVNYLIIGEVLSPKKIQDFINYKLKNEVFIDFSDVVNDKMKKEVEKYSSKKYKKPITILTKKDIKVQMNKNFDKLKKELNKWKEKIEQTKTLKELRSLVLPEIEDYLGEFIANEFKSKIDNYAPLEGLFINFEGNSLKIPNKKFADIQRLSVKMVNLFKMPVKKVKERLKNKDNLYDDLIKFLKQNSELKLPNEEQYNRFLSKEESEMLLNNLKNGNMDIIQVYDYIKKHKRK